MTQLSLPDIIWTVATTNKYRATFLLMIKVCEGIKVYTQWKGSIIYSRTKPQVNVQYTYLNVEVSTDVAHPFRSRLSQQQNIDEMIFRETDAAHAPNVQSHRHDLCLSLETYWKRNQRINSSNTSYKQQWVYRNNRRVATRKLSTERRLGNDKTLVRRRKTRRRRVTSGPPPNWFVKWNSVDMNRDIIFFKRRMEIDYFVYTAEVQNHRVWYRNV